MLPSANYGPCLRSAAARAGCQIVGAAAIHTTVTSYECGAKVEQSAAVTLYCPDGHEWDQDKNAACNMLSLIDKTFGQPHQLRKPDTAVGWQKLEVSRNNFCGCGGGSCVRAVKRKNQVASGFVSPGCD